MRKWLWHHLFEYNTPFLFWFVYFLHIFLQLLVICHSAHAKVSLFPGAADSTCFISCSEFSSMPDANWSQVSWTQLPWAGLLAFWCICVYSTSCNYPGVTGCQGHSLPMIGKGTQKTALISMLELAVPFLSVLVIWPKRISKGLEYLFCTAQWEYLANTVQRACMYNYITMRKWDWIYGYLAKEIILLLTL